MKEFDFNPSQWVPFRDKAILDRIRNIKREDITKHPNPRFKIKVVKDDMVEHIFVTDMFHRIKSAADENGNIAPESYDQRFLRSTKNYPHLS